MTVPLDKKEIDKEQCDSCLDQRVLMHPNIDEYFFVRTHHMIQPDVRDAVLEMVIEVESRHFGVHPQKGDHVSVSRHGGLYHHHGVCMGYNNILHCTGEPGWFSVQSGGCTTSKVRLDTLQGFVGNKPGIVTIVKSGADIRPDSLCMLGEYDYNLISNNCEHFARYVTREVNLESQQVLRAKMALGAIALSIFLLCKGRRIL